MGGGGGGVGVLPERWVCAVPKPLPYLLTKSEIFPTLFMTWPKIWFSFMTVVADTVALYMILIFE